VIDVIRASCHIFTYKKEVMRHKARKPRGGYERQDRPHFDGRRDAMRITAVTCVKNEGPFLLEWIAFNRVIGVTDFLFYSNDCTDETDTLLDLLDSHGIVTHLPNPADPDKSRNYQMQALKKARRQKVVKNADWVWVADVDEFLNIHVGDHTIPALIDACGNPQVISVTFQFFGNDGVEGFVDTPVITQFKRSHNPDIWCGDTAIEVKSLVRQDFPLDYYGAHRPFHNEDEVQPTWTDASGRPVPRQFRRRINKRRIRAFPTKGAREFATLNHYALRSLDSYLVKNDRGDVNREFRVFDDTYWRERNDTSFFDDSILRYLPALEREIAALKSLKGVAALHDEAVRQHCLKRDALLQQETYQDMRRQLQNANPYPPIEAEIRAEIGLA